MQFTKSRDERKTMIPLQQALSIVLANARRLGPAEKSLDDIEPCTLAQPVLALENHPPFSSSAVDGYAVRLSDLADLSSNTSMRLPIAGIGRAGDPPQPIQPGTTVRIMTGAPVPKGADAVIMQEDVRVEQTFAVLNRLPSVGENIRPEGGEFFEGDVVLDSGEEVTPSVIALLSSLGYAKVSVYRKPRVAVITTGDEICGTEDERGPGRLRDANTPFLKAALHEIGIDSAVVLSGIKDDREALFRSIAQALTTSEVLIIAGGVSVGDYDLVRPILGELGVQERFWRIDVKPGKPLYFGTKGNKLVFGLPGNPVAVGVMFYELVRPALLSMMGRKEVCLKRVTAKAVQPITKKSSRLELVRGRCWKEGAQVVVMALAQRDSHMLSSLAKANCLIHFPSDRNAIATGDDVKIDLLPHTSVEDCTALPQASSAKAICGNGRVVAVSISKKKGIPKTNVPAVILREDWGFENDVHAGKWHRQVSLLAIESINKVHAQGINVRPGAFAENITTSSIDLTALHIGDRLRVGSAQLEITQIGKECESPCAIYYRTGDCVMPREGVFACVVRGGEVRPGDDVQIISHENASGFENHVVKSTSPYAEVLSNG